MDRAQGQHVSHWKNLSVDDGDTGLPVPPCFLEEHRQQQQDVCDKLYRGFIQIEKQEKIRI
jgi:hypothetical protein